MPLDPGPFKGCYSVISVERTSLMRQEARSLVSTRAREIIMAGRAGIFSCFYALILFLSLTQFAKSQPTLQENRKFLLLKDFFVVKAFSHTNIR